MTHAFPPIVREAQMPDQMPPTRPRQVPPDPDLPEAIEEPPTGLPVPSDPPPPTQH